MDKFVIFDGNSIINRAFYALPLLSNSKGEFSNGVYGFANILIKALLEIKPKYVAVALDYGKKTFRHEIYKDYKGTRKPTPVELKSQFSILKNMLQCMGITYIEKENIEADDLIGVLSNKFDTKNIVITGDKDSFQLINKNTDVWLTKKGITEVKVYDEKSYNEEYGLVPNQVVDLKALMGDSSDNIPGVAGVGEKTALDLMQKFGSLDGVYEHIDDIAGKLKEKLLSGEESAYLSQDLARIRTELALDVKLEDFEVHFPFDSKVYDFFKNYEFHSLLKRTDLFREIKEEDVTKKYNANILEIKSLEEVDKQIKHIEKAKMFAFDIDNDKFCFAYDKNCEFVVKVQSNLIDNLDIGEVFQHLKDVFESKDIVKMCYDIKLQKHLLDNFGVELRNTDFDALLAYYLLVAGERDANKQSLFSLYDLDKSFEAINLFYVKDKLLEALKQNNLFNLYEEIEFPLIFVLYDMEKFGFKIDEKILLDLKDRYKAEVSQLEQTIKNLAGCDFNVNSPKQLGEVLFGKLGLSCAFNKKKSTSIEYLEAMYDLHPIIPAIIRYRKINKILTTYVEGYSNVVNPKDNLIHTVFNQTLTTTGRLSSSEPNLQNIPVRDDEGKNLRKIFVSRYKDGALVSADYSQIELRLLAHYCGDSKLIDAFNNNIDIHSLTASEVFNVPIQDVNATMRRTAKAVNFGIVYGISEFGLSQNINSSISQAKEYIAKYFERYPKIKDYTDSAIAGAKTSGYAYSLYGRRRKINELNQSNYIKRQFGERVAMNMPLQGTASDIIKIAMIKVADELKKQKLKSKLILQVHDELIVDAPNDEIVKVAKILKDCMENVSDLKVKLKVEVSSGKSLFDC